MTAERPDTGQPPYAALLAVIPGAFALASELRLWRRPFHLRGSAATVEWAALLVLCTALVVAGFIRRRRLAAWSFPALGVMLAAVSLGAAVSPFVLLLWLAVVALLVLAWRGRTLPLAGWEAWLVGLLVGGCLLCLFVARIGPAELGLGVLQGLYRIGVAPVSFLALLSVPAAAAGVLLGRRAGLLGVLVFVGSVAQVWEMVGDPEYALGMWTQSRALVTWVAMHPQLFLLVALPAAVLRLRSPRGRLVALLAFSGVAFVSAAALGAVVRPYSSLAPMLLFDAAFFLAPLAMVGLACAGLERAWPALGADPPGPLATGL